jgi:hypothetical protein
MYPALHALRHHASISEFWDLGLRSPNNTTTKGIFFGTKFVVKYWHAKHKNRECCPQHGALNPFYVGLAFLAVTIAVSGPTAENWYPVGGYVLAPGSYPNIYRRTTSTMTIELEPQNGALNPFSARLHLSTSAFT